MPGVLAIILKPIIHWIDERNVELGFISCVISQINFAQTVNAKIANYSVSSAWKGIQKAKDYCLKKLL